MSRRILKLNVAREQIYGKLNNRHFSSDLRKNTSDQHFGSFELKRKKNKDATLLGWDGTPSRNHSDKDGGDAWSLMVVATS